MKQEYFVVVLAHSLRGRLRRIHVPHQAIYIILALALLGCFSVFGFVASYARMAWKVANYNALRREADGLRARYQHLQSIVDERNMQLATLQNYAREVGAAFGIREKLEGAPDLSGGKLAPTFAESVADYKYLRSVNTLALPSRRSSRISAPGNALPGIWPVMGRLMGPYGKRMDPFSGEGAFHKGVDISAPTGTSVRSTADGIIIHAGWDGGGYGRLIVVDHGSGVQTYYAHLSAVFVNVGQEIRRGDLVGAVGSTGRTTAPHLHYEIRMNGGPINPHPYLDKAGFYQSAAKKDLF